MRRFLAPIALVLALGAAPGCQTFDPPPTPSIEDDANGVMQTEPDAPVVVRFSEPYVASSLRLEVIKVVLDAEGNLLDETSPPDLQGFKDNTVMAYDGARPDDPDATYGGSFDTTATSITLQPETVFDVSVAYMVLIEPGLEDEAGNTTVPRIRLPFTYQLTGGGPTLLPTGYYYFLLDVDGVPVQIQAFTYMKVDPVTGIWHAAFTNGNRRDALNSRPGCPASCSSDQKICALVPSPSCVDSSLPQTDLAQYVDFLPEPAGQFGYEFRTYGFARDEDNGSTAFGTVPFVIDITVGSIHVLTNDTRVNGVFRKHDDGTWRASGAISVDVLKPFKIVTKGSFQAMSLSDEQVKAVEAFGYPIPTDVGD